MRERDTFATTKRSSYCPEKLLPGGALFFSAGVQQGKIGEAFRPVSKDQFTHVDTLHPAEKLKVVQGTEKCLFGRVRGCPKLFFWASKLLLIPHKSKSAPCSLCHPLKFTSIQAQLKMDALSKRYGSV